MGSVEGGGSSARARREVNTAVERGQVKRRKPDRPCGLARILSLIDRAWAWITALHAVDRVSCSMTPSFEGWLRKKGYDQTTISSRISGARRVERYHGDLGVHFRRDGMAALVRLLRYSRVDESHGRSNPTLIPIRGVLRTNLSSYQAAVRLYRDYLASDRGGIAAEAPMRPPPPPRPAPEPPVTDPRTLSDFAFNGFAALKALIEGSRHSTVAQAIASLTLFTHPDTVRQTGGRAIFLAIRDPKRVGEFADVGGHRVALDDNKSPTDAFLWSNGMTRRGRDTQFNHVYASSGDVESYTALPNICMTPAFIAKLTDTDRNVKDLLKFRSFDLYGWRPAAEPVPQRPDGYDTLDWAPPLPAVPDVRRAIEDAMRRKPKSRTVKAAEELGWLFDRRQPAP